MQILSFKWCPSNIVVNLSLIDVKIRAGFFFVELQDNRKVHYFSFHCWDLPAFPSAYQIIYVDSFRHLPIILNIHSINHIRINFGYHFFQKALCKKKNQEIAVVAFLKIKANPKFIGHFLMKLVSLSNRSLNVLPCKMQVKH